MSINNNLDASNMEQRPPDDELDRMYRRLLDELNIPDSKRASMLAQPMHMKWKLLSKHQRYVRVQSTSYGNYGGAVKSVDLLDRLLLDVDAIQESAIVDLRMEVKTDAEWIQAFLELGGLDKLIHVLEIVQERRETRMCQDLLETVYMLGRHSPSMMNILIGDINSIISILLCLPLDPKHGAKLGNLVVDLLILFARYSEQGHMVALSAFETYRIEMQEDLRFSTIMRYMQTTDDSISISLKTKILELINLLIGSLPKVEDRMNMQTDFCFLGILEVLDDMEGMIDLLKDEAEQREDMANLQRAVEGFRTLVNEDHSKILQDAPTTGTWLTDGDILFAKISYMASTGGATREWMALLHALLVIPTDPRISKKIWDLVAETAQKIVTNPHSTATLSFKEIEEQYLTRDERYEKLHQSHLRVKELEDQVADYETEVKQLKAKHEAEMQTLKSKMENMQLNTVAPTATAKIDPKFEKYARMKKSGLPEGAIRNAMMRDQFREEDQNRFFSLDFTNTGVSSSGTGAATTTTTSTSDPALEKYAKMMKAGLPEPVIRHKMTQDGISKEKQESFFASPATPDSANKKSKEKPKLDAKYDVYVRMQAHGLPEGAIRNKMNREGLSVKEQDIFFNFGPESDDDDDMEEESKDGEEEDNRAQLESDPKFAKYLRMKKMNLPDGAIQNAMIKDGFADEDQKRFFSSGGNASGKTKKAEPKVKPKPKVEQRKPMKPLFWTKLANEKVEGTMWFDLDESDVDINLDALEESFANAPVHKPNNNQEEGGSDRSLLRRASTAGANDKKTVELFDPKRTQNVCIAFARLKMSPQMLKVCIMELDLKRLGGGADRVNMLNNIIPTQEEVSTITAFEGDKAHLGKIEQLFLELSTISHLSERIKAWSISLRFKVQVAENKENVQTLLKACAEIKGSTALKQTLKVILAVGNYMNGTTARGGAYGFKLDIFQKLQNMKSSDNKMTLLHYIVREIAEKKYTNMLRLPADLEHTQPASRISISAVSATTKQLENDVTFVKNTIKKDGDPDSTFTKIMQEFVEMAEKSLSHLRLNTEQIQTEYKDLLSLYGADDDEEFKADSNKFFELFDEFAQNFKREMSPPEAKHKSTFKRAPVPTKPAKDPIAEKKKIEAQKAQNDILSAIAQRRRHSRAGIVQ